MKISILWRCIIAYCFKLHILYEVAALSSEITYPVGSILGNSNLQRSRYNVNPFVEPIKSHKLSEFSPESYTDTNRTPKRKKNLKKKLRNRRKQVSSEYTSDNEKNRKKIRTAKGKESKMKRRRYNRQKVAKIPKYDKSMDFDSSETERRKVRKPVDIVVHIKMEE